MTAKSIAIGDKVYAIETIPYGDPTGDIQPGAEGEVMRVIPDEQSAYNDLLIEWDAGFIGGAMTDQVSPA